MDTASSFVKRAGFMLLMLMLLSIGISAQAQDRQIIQAFSESWAAEWLESTIKPSFEAAYPEYELNFTYFSDAFSSSDLALRVLAAQEAGSDPQVDFIVGMGPGEVPPETIEADVWQTFDEENLPNYVNLNPIANTQLWGVPWYGSQVLLAYDSSRIAEEEVPDTFAELVEWVNANPGQFVYTRPDRGGSGRNFVVRAIYEANGNDPSLFTPENFTPELAEEYLTPAWELLLSMHDSIYEGGSYTASNQGSMELLANGSVSMISAWSDESIIAISSGIWPETIRLTQLTDLPFNGGYVYALVPRAAANLDGAFALANYFVTLEVQVQVLEDLGAFPTINWELLPEDLQQEYNSVISDQVPPNFPGGDWLTALSDGWYRFVATNIDPASE
jgi:putative spermidine/putrescine transport system substrate-binding protein